MAYILGILFADGNIIQNKRGSWYVALYSSNKKLLDTIRKIICPDHALSVKKSKASSVFRIQIGSVIMCQSLIKLSVIPAKAKRMNLPDIPTEYVSDFVRGYFDGNGNVWMGQINRKRGKNQFALQVSFTCASKSFLISFKELLKESGMVGGSIFSIKNKNCYRIAYSTTDAMKISKIMYNLPSALYLSKKRRVFDRFLKMRP